jgi:hypothetical protein
LESGRVIAAEECNNTGKNKIPQKQTISSLNELNLGITVTPIFPTENGDRVTTVPKSNENFAVNERLLKPIDNLYPFNSELKEIASIISQVRNRRVINETENNLI